MLYRVSVVHRDNGLENRYLCQGYVERGGNQGCEIISSKEASQFCAVLIYQLRIHYKSHTYVDTLRLQYVESKIERLSYSKKCCYSSSNSEGLPSDLDVDRHWGLKIDRSIIIPSTHPVNNHVVEEMGQSILHINTHHTNSRYRLITADNGIRLGPADSCSCSRRRSIFLYLHPCRSLCCYSLSLNGNDWV